MNGAEWRAALYKAKPSLFLAARKRLYGWRENAPMRKTDF